MADPQTSDGEVQHEINGPVNGIDDEERAKMRPADIDADVREMERRKRVEMIMSSKVFKEELERIIEHQLRDGGGGASGLLQQISEIMGSSNVRVGASGALRGASCVVPINDIRGVECMAYAKGEKLLRCKLAACYRLVDLHGWSDSIFNHITVRLGQDQEHFLINPFGLLYNEITASSLVKIDMQGNIVERGTTNFGVNGPGFVLHSAIHAARPDIKCIIHLHVPAVIAVASLKCGLLPLSQDSCVIGEVSYHEYFGILTNPDERELLSRNLGPINKVMLLRNHGVVCCGTTIEEAFLLTCKTVAACETQMQLMPCGIDNLVLITDEARQHSFDVGQKGGAAVTLKEGSDGDTPKREKKQRPLAELGFEALMRILDNAGFRTGYIYRQPVIKNEHPRPKYDVEVPPAVSSLGYLFEEEEMYGNSPWRKYDGRKGHERSKWLNSPNVYQKVEVLETGTPDPKRITKWVAEASPTHSTAVKIETPLQFVPKGTDPREFKKLQQQIKENRRAGGLSAGPQSHVLEDGTSWEEIKKLQDANMSGASDQVVLVGAASKGIIQRDFQHHAVVYKTPYAKNPFDSITDEEIDEYKRIIEKKNRGESPKKPPIGAKPLPCIAGRRFFPVDEEESQTLEAASPTEATTTTDTKSPPIFSDTEDTSREDSTPRVLKIESKQAPRPIQAEVVLSDADYPQPHVERSKSARYSNLEASPDSRKSPFLRSWSLGRTKKNTSQSEATVNGDDTFSGSKDGSPTKDMSSASESSKKDKKKKKGLKTPSFLKKKDKKKKHSEG